MKKRSRRRAAALGHMVEVQDILRGNISGLSLCLSLIEVIKGSFEVWRPDIRPEEQILHLEG